jgi:spore coat polysaccharide biosynthesis protein SpsF
VARIGIITQARMTSTRLPGKILKTIKGKSLLEYHIERLRWASLPICIATTVNATDDVVVREAEKFGVNYFRGDEKDVLSRFYFAANQMKFDVIIRVTSDCPLIDGQLIRDSISHFPFGTRTYLSNCIERTYPRGFDFEVFSFELLEEAMSKAIQNSEREHVTPYLSQNVPGNIEFMSIKRSEDASKFRITVDQQEDFELICVLIEKFSAERLNCEQLIHLLNTNPVLASKNQHVNQAPI